MNSELVTGIDYSYLEQSVENIRSALNITESARPLEKGLLLSIHLQSNRPDNFSRFLENLEASLDDPSCIEVIVKIDDTDTAMNELLPRLVAKHPFVVKYISTPLVGGFFGLWSSMNDMLKVCHPHAYFLWNMNDEMAVLNKGWDTALKKYVGLFPDHIFRLRTSGFRFRNYYDYWECGFAPETSAITTKRWMDICGDWNPCLGPDSFNQCVAYYLGYHDRFNKNKQVRDVPIHDMLLAGEGAFIGLEGDRLWKRMRGATKAWYRLMSYEIQTEASRRSQKLLAHIWTHENKVEKFIIVDDTARQKIRVLNSDNTLLYYFPYKLSHAGIVLINLYRATYYYYYGGGGREAIRSRLWQMLAFLALRFDSFEWIYTGRKALGQKYRNLKRALSLLLNIARRELVSPENPAPLWLRPLGMLIKYRQIAKAKRFNRGMRFHGSVYAFDAIKGTLDWQKLRVLLNEVKWSRHLLENELQETLLKCLLLKKWYDLTNEELEMSIGRDLAFQRFIGVPLNRKLPSVEIIEEFRNFLNAAGIEQSVYRIAETATGQHRLPKKPLINNAA